MLPSTFSLAVLFSALSRGGGSLCPPVQSLPPRRHFTVAHSRPRVNGDLMAAAPYLYQPPTALAPSSVVGAAAPSRSAPAD